jgi:hypothetical protein
VQALRGIGHRRQHKSRGVTAHEKLSSILLCSILLLQGFCFRLIIEQRFVMGGTSAQLTERQQV